jgi:hypothetical protein
MTEIAPIIAFAVFFVAPLLVIAAAYALDRAEARRRSPGEETGDPISPQALSEWRKANREAFK